MNTCQTCLKEFLPGKNTKGLYCSRSCAVTVNNAKRTKQRPKCLYCQSEIKQRKGKYCSYTCQQDFQREDRITRWLNGENVCVSEYSITPSIKTYMLEEAGYRCTNPDCAVPGGFSGVNPVTGNSVLQVDHIDGIARNNRRSNVRLLCPNCHSMTGNFGNLNNGNGRSYRYPKPD